MTGKRIISFPFHYGAEAEQYSFYRIPKALFSEPVFQQLSTDAKLLYGLMLDRMQLSLRNRWLDEEGRVYIYFTIGSVMEALNCGNKKASQLMAELDDKKGIGLITRIRQGQGKPDRIYVHKCIIPEMAVSHIQKCQKDTSKDVFSTSAEMSERHRNNTDKNKTEDNETLSIASGGKDVIGAVERYEYYRACLWDQLCLDALLVDYPYEEQRLKEILELLVETICTEKETIRISGEEKPAAVVKGRLMKLNSEHIRYVIDCMRANTSRVRNIRQYLLAALYNAPSTMSNYYSALVNHDMYGKGD